MVKGDGTYDVLPTTREDPHEKIVTGIGREVAVT